MDKTNPMKKLLTLLFILTASVAIAQVKGLNDLVRSGSLNASKIANAFEAGEVFTATGTNTYAISPGLGIYGSSSGTNSTYQDGDMFTVLIQNTNTSSTVTFNVNAEGAISVKDNEGNDLEINELKSGGTYKFRYTSTGPAFRVIHGIEGSGGGGVADGDGWNQKTVATTTYTVTDADHLYKIIFTSATGCDVTLSNTVSVDTKVQFWRPEGTGDIQAVVGGTADLNAYNNDYTIECENCGAEWFKRTATIWDGYGQLGASGAAAWGSITGTLSAQTDLQTALDAKAPLASPALTGTPTAPTATLGTNTIQIATTAFVNANAFGRTTSLVYPDGLSYKTTPNLTLGSGSQDFEFVNIGNTGITDNIGNNVMAFVGINGRPLFVRNMEWDQVNQKWLTPDKTASSYGSACLELGGEAVIAHATPAGVDFTDVPHEITLASANGTDGEPNNKVSSGYFFQSKAPIYARFNSTAYNPTSTANSWNDVTGAHPLLWMSSQEGKGTDNELARFELNGGTGAGTYPGVYFAKSRGTLGTKNVVVTNELSSRIGYKAWDGDEYHITAAIETVTRGTMGNNNVGQEIRFATSPTTTANLATRFVITQDGAAKSYVPYRHEVAAITTIPDYTGNGYSPALGSGTVFQFQPVSTTTGGAMLQGFTTPTNTAIPFWIRGIHGHTTPTAPSIVLQALKHNGTTNFTAIGATEQALAIRNNTTDLITVSGNGSINMDRTVTGAGTTGAQTINKLSGTVNFAAGATSLVVTNSLVSANSIVYAVVRTNDATAYIKNVVPAAGSFTINLGAAATAETSVGFFVTN